jgi:hypothetical protein
MATSLYAAKDFDSAWQAGTLRAVTSDTGSRTVGVLNQGHGILAQHEYTVLHYVIDAPGFTYEANQTINSRRDKPYLVTVHAAILFTVHGHDLSIKDEEGKVRKLLLVQKVARQ